MVFRSMSILDTIRPKAVGSCGRVREKVPPEELSTARFGKIGNMSRDRAISISVMGGSGLRPSSRKASTITILPRITRTYRDVYGGRQTLRSDDGVAVADHREVADRREVVQEVDGVHRGVTDLVIIHPSGPESRSALDS